MTEQPEDGTKLWLWKNGDHFFAYAHEYPTHGGGDPMTLGEPAGWAIFKTSSPPATGPHAAIASTGEQPEAERPHMLDVADALSAVASERDAALHAAPSPSVVDYTERAREEELQELWLDLAEKDDRTSPEEYPDMALLTREEFFGYLKHYASALASEHQAAAMRAFGKRVWSDTEEVAYQAGVSDTRVRLRARLQEPDEELIVSVIEAIERTPNLFMRDNKMQEQGYRYEICWPGNEPTAIAGYRDYQEAVIQCQKLQRRAFARAALTKIAEMLK